MGENIMAHGDHEYDEWLGVMEEAHMLNQYLGAQSKKVFDNKNYQLNRKRRLVSAKIQDLKEDIKEEESKPTTRELKGDDFANRLSAHVAGGLALGTALAVGISSQNPDIHQVVMSGLSFGTAALGGLMGYINNKCYQKKPLSNAIKGYIIHKKEKALTKLNNELSQTEAGVSNLSQENTQSTSKNSAPFSRDEEEPIIELQSPFKRIYFDCMGFRENLNINDDEFIR